VTVWVTMLSMGKTSPLSEVVAARCTQDLVAKLDAVREVLVAASPIAFRLSRSDVARTAIELGAEELLRRHNLNSRVP
jgi:hypothetical protein